ncbi:jg24407 [Pararge aegeria aegeria]|nr:jg24407 [Pararge aegeria aegeria]
MVSAQMKSGLLMGFGSFMVVSGAVAAVFWPSMFFAQLRRMMILSPTSTSFGIWREVPIPMYLECFMFNITNVEDIVAGKNVPVQVEQLGPYVYREFHIKENITWNDNNTVTFYNKRTWVFQPEMSNGSLSDGITSINPIVAAHRWHFDAYMVLPDSGPVRVQGIDGVEYAANDSLFDNGHNYPNKECYCDVVRDDDCLPPGALNVSACRYGAPAFVSQPHFYNMHPHYPAKIRGLKPTDDMNFKLSLEMYTGMPLQVSAQLQINLLVRHVGGMA